MTSLATRFPRDRIVSAVRRSTDQTRQVGKNQDQGRGEHNQARLTNFRVFEHGHLPFVFVGVALNARSEDLSGCSVTPERGLKSHSGKTRQWHLLTCPVWQS